MFLIWTFYLLVLSTLVALASLFVEAARSASGASMREGWLLGFLAIPSLALAGALLPAGIPGVAGWGGGEGETGALAWVGSAEASHGAEGGGGLSGWVTEGFLGLEALGTALVAWIPGGAGAFLLLWGGLSLVLALRWGVAHARLRTRSRRWRRGEVVGRPVCITDGAGPGLLGVFRTEVVLPPWVLALPEEDQALVLAHEEEHRRRRDPALLGLARLLVVLFPWNLPLWWMGGRMREAVELDCDRGVARRHPQAIRRYAELLLLAASRPGASPRGLAVAAPLASFADRTAPLHRRILMLTRRTEHRRPLRTLFPGGAALALALLALLLPSPDGASAAGDDGLRSGGLSGEGGTLVEEGASRLAEAQTGSDTIRFTPFTVAPEVQNREEVARALVAEYPPVLREAGIGGTALLYFYIDEEGRVRELRIHESSGFAPLDQAALRVGAAFRFSPAMNREERVPVWIQIPVTFTTRS